MSSPGQGAARAVRSCAVAAVLVTLAAIGHTHASTAPTLPALLGAFGACWVAAGALAHRRMTFPVLLTLVLASQLPLHVLFGSADPAGSLGHQHHSVVPAGGAGEPGLLMLGLHVSSAVLTAMFLAFGESALWSLATWLAPLAHCLLHTQPTPNLATRGFLGAGQVQRLRPRIGLGCLGARGPPLFAQN